MPLSLTAPVTAHPVRAEQGRDFGDRYLVLLCGLLLGYATFGKGFAYIGVPPLFVSEIVLVLGLVALLASGCWLAMLMTLPSLAIVLLIGWVVLRTLPYLGLYRFDALRDSVLAIYGVFAFIIVALLLQKPQRLGWLIGNYSRFALFYGFSGAALAYATSGLSDILSWPFSGVPVVFVRMGEASVHLCGAAVFVLLGLRRVPLLWVGAVLVGFVMVSVSRGAMLSFIVPLCLAALLGGKLHRIVPIAAAGGAILSLVMVLGVQVETDGGRVIGPAQLINNVESLVGRSDASNLDGTKTWRLRWWHSIEDYTVHGPYFWTGKGFGVNLAIDDGYVVGEDGGRGSGQPVRAPHNAHLNMLARAGVPGLALWLFVFATWFALLFSRMLAARRNGDEDWAKLFIWIGCYGLSQLINASFDVALEGPMLGIWFWCIVGLGIGSSMLYGAAQDVRLSPGSLARGGR
ncbi:O-antigen ligase domain-containing protein [Bosea caraganae]|uniref:O-antigen ligase domain-containing protein n=1 Tax=Bosea caraganae TaxID=2763117 RepID=A0A370L4Z5_9HYPH|nr:O-antigen ligase family protein [Bosea caraganae]RDJ24068.1 O-antigen ligase domain-containing protein [Bosea caraganae]RDJ30110.1 O-antigen ligase domain-containing protein [Bosea caraganae]